MQEFVDFLLGETKNESIGFRTWNGRTAGVFAPLEDHWGERTTLPIKKVLSYIKAKTNDAVLDFFNLAKQHPGGWVSVSNDPCFKEAMSNAPSLAQLFAEDGSFLGLLFGGHSPSFETAEEVKQGLDDEGDEEITIEDVVYQQQEALIAKKYGKAVADRANYGWGSSSGRIETKVYRSNGTMILISTFDEDDNPSFPQTIDHSWEPYGR